MVKLDKLLSGGDLRSIGKSNSVAVNIKNQNDFDELFKLLMNEDRIVVMRAADTIEKVTISNPSYLSKYKNKLLELCNTAVNKELLWHLALLIPRLNLNNKELNKAWNMLTTWAKNKTNSRIVRVNSLQALFELAKQQIGLFQNFNVTLSEMENENIPSINARIRIIRKQIAISHPKPGT